MAVARTAVNIDTVNNRVNMLIMRKFDPIKVDLLNSQLLGIVTRRPQARLIGTSGAYELRYTGCKYDTANQAGKRPGSPPPV